ncbi:hypothetical protein LNKW23_44900 [Paralimibaculum aggregatum]|uniref:LysM domain-containing protein n=1 Tax=Paralimibaculum aggregatum TaxID=3036245 RepID=A0ABQ6LT79_9RHOB|nr:LysM peptidoglycan-binding domain-containing protein [Limibaculum sp. NKW23]GMG85272.1 hypothetical protein LNKW23_44900 [Limibaculum sp. NKW23]
MGRHLRDYKLKSGDTLVALARRYKHSSWKPIWNAKRNARLRGKRKRPECLQAGDIVFIPVAPVEKKLIEREIWRQNMLRNSHLDWQADLRAGIAQLERSRRVLATYQVQIDAMADRVIAQLNTYRRKIKNVGNAVDAANTVINVTRSVTAIGRKAHKASKATGDELRKINKELEKSVKKKIVDGKVEAVRKQIRHLQGTMLEPVHIVNDSWDKINSPSFWSMAVAQMLDGKGWSDAVTYDVDEDFDNKIAIINRDRRRYKASIAAEIRKQATAIADMRRAIDASARRAREIEDASMELMDLIRH